MKNTKSWLFIVLLFWSYSIFSSFQRCFFDLPYDFFDGISPSIQSLEYRSEVKIKYDLTDSEFLLVVQKLNALGRYDSYFGAIDKHLDDDYLSHFALLEKTKNQNDRKVPNRYCFDKIGLLRRALYANIYEREEFYLKCRRSNFSDEDSKKKLDVCTENCNETHRALLHASGIKIKNSIF